jgi:hypothetical protein
MHRNKKQGSLLKARITTRVFKIHSTFGEWHEIFNTEPGTVCAVYGLRSPVKSSGQPRIL